MIREAFLEAAEAALALVRDHAVTSRWQEPSALPGMTVGGLVAHLVWQVIRADEVLAADPPTHAPIDVLEHYRRSAWVGGDLESEANLAIRDTGEAHAAAGPEQVADSAGATLERVRARLVDEPADRLVALPWAGWALTLDDFLLTRTMELVVHADDLVASVGLATPEMPAAATDATIQLLAAVAAQRHGPYPLIRALTRAERAPSSILAF
ncbi:MAG: maleylpyruvate isomerase N-terminal domain-containing protein [Micromonosporaceae bacterium]